MKAIYNPEKLTIKTRFRVAGGSGSAKDLTLEPGETKVFSDEEAGYLLRIYGMNQLDPEKHQAEGFLKVVDLPKEEPKKEEKKVEEKKEEVEEEKAEEPEEEKEEKPKEFKCEVCGKVFKARIALAGHMKSHG